MEFEVYKKLGQARHLGASLFGSHLANFDEIFMCLNLHVLIKSIKLWTDLHKMVHHGTPKTGTFFP